MTLDILLYAFIGSIVALTLALALSSLNPASLSGLSAVVGVVLGLATLARLKRQGWAMKLSIAVASSSLIYIGIYVQALDLISLYGLFLLVMATGELNGLTETVRPLADRSVRSDQLWEVNKVLTAVLIRMGILLAASLVLATLIWTTLGLLSLGPTSAFTAFILAFVVIVTLAFLSSQREGE